MKFSIITSSVRFIKDIKRFDDHFFVKENFLMYFHRNNNLKYFITFCISVFCNLSAVKTSKVQFLYLSFFKFSVFCRCFVCLVELSAVNSFEYSLFLQESVKLDPRLAVLKGFMIPVDTGRKLNVHKTSRRSHGRPLNVLCTFHLRPVSAGIYRVYCS